MDRDIAARLLGVSSAADRDDVLRAWRLWARAAHPDAGGDRGHFEALCIARDVLLATRATTAAARPGRPGPSARPAEPAFVSTAPRMPLRQVLCRPRHPLVLLAAAVGSVLLGGLPRLLSETPLALAVLPGACAAAIWAAIAQRSILRVDADAGHRIALLALLWLPIWLGQLIVSAAMDIETITVLPLTAVPFAAAIACQNSGAGLWRPVHRHR